MKLWESLVSSGSSEEESVPCLSPSFWGLLATLDVPGLLNTSVPIAASTFTWHSLYRSECVQISLLWHQYLGLTLILRDLTLTWLHLQRLYFKITSHSQFLGRHDFLRGWEVDRGSTVEPSTVFILLIFLASPWRWDCCSTFFHFQNFVLWKFSNIYKGSQITLMNPHILISLFLLVNIRTTQK